MKNLESLCSSRTIRWVGLIIGCVNIVASGVLFAANAFITDMRDVFNLTQSNGEIFVFVLMSLQLDNIQWIYYCNQNTVIQ